MTVGISMCPPSRYATRELNMRWMMCNCRVAFMMSRMHVTREVVLDCPTAEAWELLTDPDELAAWLGRPVDFELNILSEQRVGFVWNDDDRELSTVEFALEEVEGGTRLTVTETA